MMRFTFLDTSSGTGTRTESVFLLPVPPLLDTTFKLVSHTILGAADIIFEKEITRKIPGKGGCQNISVDEFVHCWELKLAGRI